MNHWLYELGLADLLQLPVGLKELEIEFQPGIEADQDVMIVDFGDIFYEIFPRYPELRGGAVAWEGLVGGYERYARLPSGDAGPEKLGESEITIEDGRLHMTGSIGPIVPIDETNLIILSGPFAGETITHDPDTGNIYHQGFVYKLRANDTQAEPKE
ncbi:MAG: hypothetical protein GWP61_09055 [Chloroflexi bacterium]|nr:hypothetical protein [Chloroflexota bacterium]